MDLDEVVDQLYGLPPAEFVAARDAAARELRVADHRAEAARIKDLRKPTSAAAAVNHLVRQNRADVERFLAAAEALREVQLTGKGDLLKATRQEREALNRLVRTGGEQVRQSLEAAAVDKEAARELQEARLVSELEPRGFGTLLADAHRTSRGSAAVSVVHRKKPDDPAARAKLKEARRQLADAQAREREARRAWDHATAELRKAEAVVSRTEKKLANSPTQASG
jgi:hypothetical protein